MKPQSFINQTDLKVMHRRSLTSDRRGAVVLFCKVETVRNLNLIFLYVFILYLYIYICIMLCTFCNSVCSLVWFKPCHALEEHLISWCIVLPVHYMAE